MTQDLTSYPMTVPERLFFLYRSSLTPGSILLSDLSL
jgi:hypothetical protein